MKPLFLVQIPCILFLKTYFRINNCLTSTQTKLHNIRVQILEFILNVFSFLFGDPPINFIPRTDSNYELKTFVIPTCTKLAPSSTDLGV